MTTILSTAGLIALSFMTPSAGATTPATVHSFFKVVQTAGQESPSWKPIKKAPHPLEAGDRVRTGAGSWAELRLQDTAKVRLEANADFALPAKGDGPTEVTLAAGTVSAWVQKRANREFRVRTPNATCSVKGTYFRVAVAGGVTTVELFEGVVAVADAKGREILLQPNQKVEVREQVGKPVELQQDKSGEKAGKNDKAQNSGGSRGDDVVSQTAASEDEAVGATSEWTANHDESQLNELMRELDLDYRKEYVSTQDVAYSKTEQQKLGLSSIDSGGNRVRTESFIAPNGGIATITQSGGIVEGELVDALNDTSSGGTTGGTGDITGGTGDITGGTGDATGGTGDTTGGTGDATGGTGDTTGGTGGTAGGTGGTAGGTTDETGGTSGGDTGGTTGDADRGHGNETNDPRHDDDNPGQGNQSPPGLDDRGHGDDRGNGGGHGDAHGDTHGD